MDRQYDGKQKKDRQYDGKQKKDRQHDGQQKKDKENQRFSNRNPTKTRMHFPNQNLEQIQK